MVFRRGTLLLLMLAALLVGGRAQAHPMPESQVWVDTDPQGLTLTLRLPLNRLEFAFGQALATQPAQVLERHGEALSRYLLAHVGVRSEAGSWTVLRPSLAVRGDGDSAELEAVMPVRAPPNADLRRFVLLYDVITHEVRTHRAMVFLRTDWAAGHVGAPPRELGSFTPEVTTLDLRLDAATPGAGARSLFALGAGHIAEGTDHLLFLLTLLLVAPVAAAGGRWAHTRSVRAALRRTAAVVTAFTAGHSVTLALGSLGLVNLPAQWIETAVAASIAVAAWHAWRPLHDRGEIAMAGGFGLLHGLAFSASLSGAGLTAAQHALALLSFNLGIEAVQLLLVAVAMPPLLWLAVRTPALYARVRRVGAVLSAGAAGWWILERVWPQAAAVLEAAIGVELRWLPVLFAVAVAAALLPRPRQGWRLFNR